MNADECAVLEALVRAGDFSGAEQLCADRLARLEAEAEVWTDWKAQAGYVCFLNEGDLEARYNRAPVHFEELAGRDPHDANAWFWLGYLDAILFDDASRAAERLQRALALHPAHPYAALVLAGISQTAEAGIDLLQTVIHGQGSNARAVRELARLHLERGEVTLAVEAMRKLVSEPAYIEKGFGIMNGYINDVLTGARHLAEWRAEARRSLLSLESDENLAP
jgi:tetratricopeptide (TPR) repeat protein